MEDEAAEIELVRLPSFARTYPSLTATIPKVRAEPQQNAPDISAHDMYAFNASPWIGLTALNL